MGRFRLEPKLAGACVLTGEASLLPKEPVSMGPLTHAPCIHLLLLRLLRDVIDSDWIWGPSISKGTTASF